MRSFNPKLTFESIYLTPFFLNIVMYWNYVPFFALLLALVASFLANNVILQTGLFLLIAVINILYQLYIWSYSFFTAQDVSMNKIGIPDYNLNDLFTDWKVKLNLIAIRVVYYLPVLVILTIVIQSPSFPLELRFINALEITGNVLTILRNWIITAASLGVVLVVIDNTVIVAAMYYYSYTGKLFAALNVLKVAKFIAHNWLDMFVIVLLNLSFYGAFFLFFSLFGFLLRIPILSILILSVLTGFFTSWHTIYMPTLYGQMWLYSNKKGI